MEGIQRFTNGLFHQVRRLAYRKFAEGVWGLFRQHACFKWTPNNMTCLVWWKTCSKRFAALRECSLVCLLLHSHSTCCKAPYKLGIILIWRGKWLGGSNLLCSCFPWSINHRLPRKNNLLQALSIEEMQLLALTLAVTNYYNTVYSQLPASH